MPSVLALGVELAASTSTKKGGSSPVFLLVLIAFAGLFYFFILRPRSQRQRQQREQTRAAKVGDEVATIGGLVGTIVAEDGDRVTVSTGNGTELVFLRQAIGRRLEPPTQTDEPDAELKGPVPGFEPTKGADAPSGDEPEPT